MKFICLQENLNQGLNIARLVITKNTTLPIVNNFLFEVKDGQLIIIATNLEIGIKTIVRGKVEENGIITVPAVILSNFVAGLPNKKIFLETNRNNINIECEKFKSTLNGMGAEDFPLIPKTQQEQSINISADKFKIGLNQVVSAASSSEIRPELSGVFMRVLGKKIVLAATDSFRLAEKVIELDKDYNIEYSAILPSKTVNELIRIIDQESKTSEGEIKVEVFKDQNQILFKIGATELTSRLIEAEFPDYPQIIPKSFVSKIVVNKQELLKNIKVAGIFSNSRVNDVKILVNNKTLQVKSNTPEVGENNSEFTIIKSEGEASQEEIAYNYHYLLDGLSNIYSDELLMELNGSSDPTVLRPTNDPGYLYIMRPLKIT